MYVFWANVSLDEHRSGKLAVRLSGRNGEFQRGYRPADRWGGNKNPLPLYMRAGIHNSL